MQSLRRFLAQRPDGPLFHYTGAAGLLGIFQRKEIWATDALYMNDAEEMRHADIVLRQEYQARLADGALLQEDKAMFLSGLEALEERQRQRNAAPTYVVSFSSHGDQLSQWRAYCQGGGFSIGFDWADLKFAVSSSQFCLVKCVYDAGEQRDLIRACIDYSMPRLRWPEKLERRSN